MHRHVRGRGSFDRDHGLAWFCLVWAGPGVSYHRRILFLFLQATSGAVAATLAAAVSGEPRRLCANRSQGRQSLLQSALRLLPLLQRSRAKLLCFEGFKLVFAYYSEDPVKFERANERSNKQTTAKGRREKETGRKADKPTDGRKHRPTAK